MREKTAFSLRPGTKWKEEKKMSRFEKTLRQMEKDPEILKMKRFRQHGNSNTYKHSLSVALCADHLGKQLHWKVDGAALARGAMLHDYYLYEIKEQGISDYQHGVRHPEIALQNARKRYRLSEKEANIIRSHMWPLTLFHVPKSKEAVLVCAADKYVASREFINSGVSAVKSRIPLFAGI